MHAQDLVVDDGSHGEAVKAVGEGLPEPDAEPALALVVEAVDAVDGGAFVVAPEEEEVVREFDLVGEEEAYRLDAVLPPVDVVAKEEVVRLRREATAFEQPEKVCELAMHVPCMHAWGRDQEQINS